MATTPVIVQYAGPQPYKLTNVEANINLFYSNSPFYPNQLNDLAIWLDGTDILNNGSNNPADGTAITAWANKAPNSITVKQDTIDYQPVFNSGVGVFFSNANANAKINGLDTTYSSGQNETIFILINNRTTTNSYNLLYPTITNGRQLYLDKTPITLTTAKRPEAIILESGVVTNATPTLVSSWSSNVDGCNASLTVNHYINGLLTGTFTKSEQYATGGNTLIGTDNYGANGFNGDISEIIIYSNVLSDSDREKVESYLYWKWNTFTLDPSNPYRSEAYSNQVSLYPNIDSNLIPAVPRDLFSGEPTLDSRDYPLIKNFIQLPNILKNTKF